MSKRFWWGIVSSLAALWLFVTLTPILMPFFVGMILAYLGDPLADRLEARGLSRRLAVSVVFVLLSVVVIGLTIIVIPVMWRQLVQLADAVPMMINWTQQTVLPRIQEWTGSDFTADLNQVRDMVTGHWKETGSVAAQLLAQLSRSGLALAFWLGNLAIIPVVTFYLLLDWDRMKARIRDAIPRDWVGTVTGLAHECDEVLSAFMRGQLLVMLGLGVVYATGLTLLGVKFGFLIGVLAGLASIVPYLGVIFGVVLAELVAFFQFQALWPLAAVGGVFVLGQILESTVFQPLLLGDRIGLHPVIVIFSVMAGGQLFGFVGVLLALPVAAMLMVVLRYLFTQYKASRMYTSKTSVYIDQD
ncbi:AI-2E family transporter [Larsenimonas rhizosphaerae]|uniref:AI-2E family transporter n=1 Tax=Larsenimonas rhizosphaerae TaxID=2944682 RepID=UPI002034786B|nr:AI-2E family transporter [Larsenimonas rhizosphaerae]MCM2130431.1 AI-2E family transporter [Larsenimonas rhizosphaerae]